MIENKNPLVEGIAECLISPNESDSNGESANVVDGLFAISRGLFAVARAIDRQTLECQLRESLKK